MNLNQFFPQNSKKITNNKWIKWPIWKGVMISPSLSPSHSLSLSLCLSFDRFHFLEGPLFICMLLFILPKLRMKKTAIVITSIKTKEEYGHLVGQNIWILIYEREEKIRGLPNFEFQGGSRHTISRFGGLFRIQQCVFV